MPSVNDCSRTMPPQPSQGWLECVGITGWLASESPAGMDRNRRLVCVGIRKRHAAGRAPAGRSRSKPAYSRPACAENILNGVSAQCSIPTGFVVQFFEQKPAWERRRKGPTEIRCFPSGHLQPKTGERRPKARAAWRNKPAGSGFVPLTVKSGRFVSSGRIIQKGPNDLFRCHRHCCSPLPHNATICSAGLTDRPVYNYGILVLLSTISGVLIL